MKVLNCIAQRPGMTGSGIYFRQLVNGLNEKGYDNALIYSFQDEPEVELPSHSVQYPIQFKTESLAFPIPGMSDDMPYESTVYGDMTPLQFAQWKLAFTQALTQAKEEFKPDVVISHHIFAMTAIVAQVFDETPIIGICHGTDLRQIQMHPNFMQLHLAGVDDLDLYLSLGPSQADQLVEMLGIDSQKILTTGGGYDASIFQADLQKKADDHFRLIFGGKMSSSKGVYELAKAMPQITAQQPKSELCLVGNVSADQKEEIKALAGKESHLRFVPALPQDQYAEVLQGADIYILPSYYEGLSLGAIEALACRCRVVMSENDNLQWLLGKELVDSGLIEFIDLPTLIHTDTPVKEEVPAYVDRIAQAVLLQLDRMKEQEGSQRGQWPAALVENIRALSWQGIIDRVDEQIHLLI